MIKDEKISSFQLTVLIVGFALGSTIVANQAADVLQDVWLSFIIGWLGGFILIGMYSYISVLNPSKSLVEILKDSFGKFFGGLISLLYIWYFIHLASLVLRNFGEFMISATLEETPMIFINISFILIIAYAVKKGLEVMARISEVIAPLVAINIILLFFSLIGEYEIKVFLPVLERGWAPVLKTSLSVLSFPFGETVVFMMIFPHFNKRKNIIKVSLISLVIAGLLLLNLIIRNVMALGANMMARYSFPSHAAIGLIPNINLDVVVDINLAAASIIKIGVCMYGAVKGIALLFNLKTYKPLVLPVATIIVVLSIWVYNNILEMFNWAEKIWPYYSIPFQIIIPLLLLIISLVKKKTLKGDGQE